ncbi:hypothetical protein BJ138DRAFT_1083873 [Hygrophoropsis aurantiaca]|uniref:Uncharacterized protein n=1 Tax=Hygrophoropsis aurantiaca TaxID=72124 RepID=A0ACB8AGN6_9AGAM|nr:hypothetical protein BJ138DRAFT_1083873 [Hygrophoropsis aurantiaca]
MSHPDASPAEIDASESPSFFARKFGITSIKEDRIRWNKDWETCLKSLKNSGVVFEEMQFVLRKCYEEYPGFLPDIQKDVIRKQNALQTLLASMFSQGNFATVWLLLDEPNRQKHLMHGLVQASERALFHEDARASCPEITMTGLLKGSGNALLKFLELFQEMKSSVSEDAPCLMPCEWWDHVVDDVPKPLSDEDQFVHAMLAMVRNDFIAEFIIGVAESFSRAVVNKDKDIKSILNVMEQDLSIADGFAHALKTKRDKPIIRCENCEKSASELGSDARFMVCSTCKAKLKFSLHYCSQKCQTEDWKRHKVNCGKKAISKRLPGTAGDSTWAYPAVPDMYREMLNNGNGRTMNLRDIGAGTPQFVRSSALQLQVSMIEADKDADYFLFTASQEPIRFVVHEFFMKMVFRLLRTNAMSSKERTGTCALAQYLLKEMASTPGLSKESILRQLSSEYGIDMEVALKEFTERGGPSNETFLEKMGKGVRAMGPKLMSMGG